jgi:hypothetical protein
VGKIFVFGRKVPLPGVGVDGLWAANFRNPELGVPRFSKIFVFDLLYNFLKVFPHSSSKFLLFVRNRKLFYFLLNCEKSMLVDYDSTSEEDESSQI